MNSFFDWVQGIDSQVIEFFRDHLQVLWIEYIMVFFTTIGNTGIVWISIGLILLVTKKYRKVGFVTLLALLIGTILCDHFLKLVVARPRPFITLGITDLGIAEPDSFSFPSGHTTSSFAAAGVLAYYLKKTRYFFIALAVLVSFSRLYLMVHYPSDILVGMLLGLFSSFMAILIFKTVKNYRLNGSFKSIKQHPQAKIEVN